MSSHMAGFRLTRQKPGNTRRRKTIPWAHDDNRVQFTVGRDIRLDPPQRGDPLNYFIYPYGEDRPLLDLFLVMAFRFF